VRSNTPNKNRTNSNEERTQKAPHLRGDRKLVLSRDDLFETYASRIYRFCDRILIYENGVAQQFLHILREFGMDAIDLGVRVRIGLSGANNPNCVHDSSVETSTIVQEINHTAKQLIFHAYQQDFAAFQYSY